MTNFSQYFPNYHHESALQLSYEGPIAGVDEAGRGPWAGPVVAAAVILDQCCIPPNLNDSKKISQSQREQLFGQIYETSLIGVGIASVETIDRENILQATLGAMTRAVSELAKAPAAVLVDGNKCPLLDCPAQALVKGDQRSLSIAAASIIAKVTRDSIMRELGIEYPQYGFERHKGYGTKAHQQALTQYGVTKHHRRSFKPIRKLIENAPA